MQSWLERPGVVDVTFDGAAAGVAQRSHVEVRIGEVVDPLVVAQPVGVAVLVAQHRRVDVTGRPDVLIVGLEALRALSLIHISEPTRPY